METNRFFSREGRAQSTVTTSSVDVQLSKILSELQENRRMIVYGQEQSDQVMSLAESITR